MLLLGPEFTPLEQAILRAICESHRADRAVLEAQLSTARIQSRENTGAGFYTNFTVDPIAPIGGERERDGPDAKVEGLEYGMGFLLWFENGYAHSLEGFSYMEDTTEIAFETVAFEIIQT